MLTPEYALLDSRVQLSRLNTEPADPAQEPSAFFASMLAQPLMVLLVTVMFTGLKVMMA